MKTNTLRSLFILIVMILGVYGLVYRGLWYIGIPWMAFCFWFMGTQKED